VNEPRYAREPATLTCCFYADACDAPDAWEQFATFEECTDYDPGCPPGNADCDNDAINGCETKLDSDVNHCGSCGFRCDINYPHAGPVCDQGNCGMTCDEGWLDCNGSRTDGCETAGTACDP
jgi:hypothetical protein